MTNRIAKHIAYFESKLRPTPEVERELTAKLAGLALEAMEEAGQLTLWKEVA